jgi:carbonic anhydrase
MSKTLSLLIKIIFLLFISMMFLFGQAQYNSDQALNLLIQGNERFVQSQPSYPNVTSARRLEVFQNGQHPFATTISCSDSRVPPEYIFDRGFGDLFVIRIAGNVMATDEIGSVEYSVEEMGVPLVVVVGHTKCGAVTAVVKGAKLSGSMPKMVSQIKPAADKVKKHHPELHGDDLIHETVKENVFTSIENLYRTSKAVRELVDKGKLQVVGGIYDLETGKFEVLGRHPKEKELLKLKTIGKLEKIKDSDPQEIKAVESGFFSKTNVIFMILFIVLCALVSGIVIFTILFMKAGRR